MHSEGKTHVNLLMEGKCAKGSYIYHLQFLKALKKYLSNIINVARALATHE